MISHSALAKQLGISNAVLGSVKKELSPELHYTSKRPHLYTDEGVTAARVHLGLEKKERGPLTVQRTIKGFAVCLDTQGQTVQVAVRDARLFNRGFVIPPERLLYSDIRPGYARLKGRSPRSRGRW